MKDYQIFVDATTDFNEQSLLNYPSVKIIPMQLTVGDCEYTYGPGGNITINEFYEMQSNGSFASTSQISPSVYIDSFSPFLQDGLDVFYACFSSGMSGTYHSAQLAARYLRNEYPERKIVCVDTLCASVGGGLILRALVQKQKEGMNIEELEQWLLKYRLKVCHWFTVDTFEHLLHGGRVTSAVATIGTVLQIKPLLHVNDVGKLAVVEKPRGHRKALQSQLKRMEAGWNPKISNFVVIGHGHNLEGANSLVASVQEHLRPFQSLCKLE